MLPDLLLQPLRRLQMNEYSKTRIIRQLLLAVMVANKCVWKVQDWRMRSASLSV